MARNPNDQDSLFYHLTKVPLPMESYGTCKYVKTCGNREVILGNGVCVRCWDRGKDE